MTLRYFYTITVLEYPNPGYLYSVVVWEFEIFVPIDYKYFDKLVKIDCFCCLKGNIDRGDEKLAIDRVEVCGKMEGEAVVLVIIF